MSWSRRLHLPRTVRFRLALAFTLASLLAALLTIGAMTGVGQLLLFREVDRALREQWSHASDTPDAFENLSPSVLAAHLKPGGRTTLSLSQAASSLELLFVKPYYGRRGQLRDRHGFWVQTIETGSPRKRYRVCARELADGTLFAVAAKLEAMDRVSVQMALVGVGGFLLMASLLVLFEGAVAQRLLKGFGHAADVVDAMASGDFSQRVTLPHTGEEVTRLARSVNVMASHTESLLADLRAVTDNIAHDLRTPVTRLRGKAELALYSEDASRTLAGDVAEECDGMLELISALLEIARVAHNIGVGSGEEVDASALANEMVELFSASAETKGVTLSCALPELPIRCKTVPALLKRALANFLDNAIKFTPPGGTVTLSVEAHALTLAFTVADTGCGMEAEVLPHIFNRFYRAAAERSLPGFGLGLALVRAVAEALGGRVEVTSKPGQGSRFTLFLPQFRR